MRVCFRSEIAPVLNEDSFVGADETRALEEAVSIFAMA
jgi:hypothetical protein